MMHGSRTLTLLVPALLLVLGAPAPGAAQSAADSAAIRRTALDYIEGWYGGDAQRMERALHPTLAKRIVRPAGGSGGDRLDHMTAEQLVGATGSGGGRATPAARQRKDVRILDVFGNTASVRLDADEWVDYLHVARVDGDWKIVNVLWELRQQR